MANNYAPYAYPYDAGYWDADILLCQASANAPRLSEAYLEAKCHATSEWLSDIYATVCDDPGREYARGFRTRLKEHNEARDVEEKLQQESGGQEAAG